MNIDHNLLLRNNYDMCTSRELQRHTTDVIFL